MCCSWSFSDKIFLRVDVDILLVKCLLIIYFLINLWWNIFRLFSSEIFLRVDADCWSFSGEIFAEVVPSWSLLTVRCTQTYILLVIASVIFAAGSSFQSSKLVCGTKPGSILPPIITLTMITIHFWSPPHHHGGHDNYHHKKGLSFYYVSRWRGGRG